MKAESEGVSISVIVPVNERPADLTDLFEEYAAPLRKRGWRFEFVFVVEPWYAELADGLTALRSRGEPVRVLVAGEVLGEIGLLKAGVAQTTGATVVTLPAYYRVVPDALPALVERVSQGVDIATARRWPRRDSWVNRVQNRAFHVLLHRVSSGAGRIRDVGCGVRAMRRDVWQDLPVYGDFLRFLPILAMREGFRVEELAFPQHERDAQPRVYGSGIYLRRLIDVLGLFFLVRFIEKPLRFFGMIGAVIAGFGSLVLLVLLVQWIGGKGIADRPLLLLGVLLLVLGIQAVALGLIGEIIVHLNLSRGRTYRIAAPAASAVSAPGKLDASPAPDDYRQADSRDSTVYS